MDNFKIKRITTIEDETKVNDEIVQEFVIVTSGESIAYEDTCLSEICIFNGGACLITYIENNNDQESDSPYLDIPSGVGFVKTHTECKKFFKDIDYASTSEVETQRIVEVHKDGKRVCRTIAIVEYYKSKNPEDAWTIYDENDNLI